MYDLIAIASNQHLIVVEDIDVLTIKINESAEKVLKQNFS